MVAVGFGYMIMVAVPDTDPIQFPELTLVSAYVVGVSGFTVSINGLLLVVMVSTGIPLAE
jgi:hypothetical protein